MDNLKLLQLNYVQLTRCYENFPQSLRLLCLHGFPLKSLPMDFPIGNIVSLDLSYSKLKQVWKGTMLSFLHSLRRCSQTLFALARLSPIATIRLSSTATGPPPPISLSVKMPPIRTSAIPNSRQQIKERLLALQNPLPIASSSSSQQDSPALPLVVTACSTTDSNATTMAAPYSIAAANATIR
ncbi:LOW QUALITY PROTEIN: hypothetical protein LguiB_017876 [Lonicera macranthoides]